MNPTFRLQEKVYLVNDPDQLAGFVTGLIFRVGGFTYEVSWGDRTESTHFDFELSQDKSWATA